MRQAYCRQDKEMLSEYIHHDVSPRIISLSPANECSDARRLLQTGYVFHRYVHFLYIMLFPKITFLSFECGAINQSINQSNQSINQSINQLAIIIYPMLSNCCLTIWNVFLTRLLWATMTGTRGCVFKSYELAFMLRLSIS